MENTRAKKINFTSGGMMKKMIAFTVPMVIAALLQMLFNSADIAVVGNFTDENGKLYQSAVGASAPIINLLINLFVGVSTGSTVVMANAIGAKDEDRQHRVIHSAYAVAVACGLVSLILGFIFTRLMLVAMDTPEEILDYSVTYLRIYFLGAPATLIYNFGASLLRGAGDTKKPLLYLFVSGVMNVVVNLFAVIVLKLDVEGVAIATVISQYASAVWVTFDLIKATGGLKLTLYKIRFFGDATKEIIRIGLPAGLTTACFSLSNVLLQSCINRFGSDVIAGTSIASNIDGMINCVATGVTGAVSTSVSQCYGAKKPERFWTGVKCGLIIYTAWTATLGAALFFLGKYVVRIYTSDATVMEYALLRLHYVGCWFAISVMHNVFGAALRGIGYSTPPMIINVFFTCIVRVLYVMFVFPHLEFAVQNVHIIYPITWALSGVCQMIMFIFCCKKVGRKILSDRLSEESTLSEPELFDESSDNDLEIA